MNKFIFDSSITVYADKRIDFDELSTLIWGFCGKTFRPTIKEGNDGEIVIGKCSGLTLDSGDEYTLKICEDGACVKANDEKCLMRGFMAFLMSVIMLEPKDGVSMFSADAAEHHGKYKMANRMIHICVFPETTFFMFRKLVRLSAVLQYTHIVIEFWGMLKYDSLPELGWPNSFKKSDVKEVIEEAKKLGITPIPMFNHFGHASQCRGVNGKHVVLDQNPSLAYLFTPDGWAWDIEREETYTLLANIRKELYELFGEGEYIHLGCDEAHIYGNGFTEHENVANFFKRITEECVAEGRVPMLWGDMFICRQEFAQSEQKYACNAKSVEDAKLIRSKIAKETIICDWHYNVTETPWVSSVMFKNEGFRTMCCPWMDVKNIRAAVNTVCEASLFGVLQTTWHTLSASMYIIFECAKLAGIFIPEKLSYSASGFLTATLMRKITFEEGTYEDMGYTAYQTGANYRNDV
ncbi:MAG: family 20 glycosylhydrolase [Clostridia bacterium]|nr:family 20 glycosylhydrolase [Clostridia bacterium]